MPGHARRALCRGGQRATCLSGSAREPGKEVTWPTVRMVAHAGERWASCIGLIREGLLRLRPPQVKGLRCTLASGTSPTVATRFVISLVAHGDGCGLRPRDRTGHVCEELALGPSYGYVPAYCSVAPPRRVRGRRRKARLRRSAEDARVSGRTNGSGPRLPRMTPPSAKGVSRKGVPRKRISFFFVRSQNTKVFHCVLQENSCCAMPRT